MGLNIGFSNSSSPRPGEPCAWRFTINKCWQIGNFCIADITYPDATTYGGRKLLLYHASKHKILTARALDPHFVEENSLSPIARFEPTERGMRMARLLAESFRP